jgi:hypothetical protein
MSAVVPFISRAEQRARTAYHWAEKIRQDLGHGGFCADPADVYDSEFRRFAGLRPIHLCRLRQLATEQIAVNRKD